MTRSVLLSLTLGALAAPGCAPRHAPRTEVPPALAERPYEAPSPTRGALSSGVPVVVVENHEVPLAYVRVSLVGGGWSDPVGKEGLAQATLDMLDEGAGGLDAAGLERELRKAGLGLGTGAGDDGASLTVGGLARNLDTGLGLLAKVAFQPDFPADDWALMQKQYVAGLEKRRRDPDSIAARVFERVLFGEAYQGRTVTEASLAAINPTELRAAWERLRRADDAVIFVGGDVTLASVLPLLEKHFGSWKPTNTPTARPSPNPLAAQPAIHFVDRPGAAQSVVRVGGYVAKPTDPDWIALTVANMGVGGQFTSRLNLNLREEKGWTYGARCSVSYDLAGGRLVASAGIQTPHTVPAVKEFWKELADPRGVRPLEEGEVAYGRDALAYGRPLRYESADFLLGQEEAIWRYGLPADWTTGFVGRVRGVTTESARAAWVDNIDPSKFVTVVVGDASVVLEGLKGLGLPVIERDADGNLE